MNEQQPRQFVSAPAKSKEGETPALPSPSSRNAAPCAASEALSISSISNRFHWSADRSKLRKPFRSPTQSVLAQWRGIDLAELEKARMPSAKTINGVMPEVLSKLGMDRRRTEAEIARVWNHLIDPNIVAHAQPTGLHKGTLFVTVDHSVWLSEIVRYRRKEILERLQHSFGRDLIARISFRVGG